MADFKIKKFGSGIAQTIDEMLEWFKKNNRTVYRDIQKVAQKHKLY